MEPPALEVTAQRWSGAPGALRAEGEVVAVLGDDRIAAVSAELRGRSLVLRDGRWERHGTGALSFETLTLTWDNGLSGSASQAVFRGLLGGRAVRVTGAGLTWDGAGSLVGDDVELAPCDCDAPPFSVRARHLAVDAGETASFRGGWVKLLDLPVLPIPPHRIALARRSGLLPPALGWSEDGFRLATPAYLTLGDPADLTLAPEVRTARSIRGLGTLRYALPGGTGAVAGSYGTDWITRSDRGAAEWTHSASRGTTGAAVDAQVLGDADYLRDYADAFLVRTTPWVESRGWLGAGPLESWGSTYGFDTTALDRAGAALRSPALLPGAVVAEVEVEATAIEASGAPGAGVGRVRLVRETFAGPVRLRPELSGRVATTPDAWGAAALEVALPAWKQRARLEPSFRGSIAAPGGAWSLGPGLRWSRSGGAEVRVAASLQPDGWRASGSAGWTGETFHGWGQVESGPGAIPDLAGAGFGGSSGPVALGATAVWTTRLPEPVAAASPSVGVTVGPLRLSAASVVDLVDPSWQSLTGAVRWTHPARCLVVEASTRVDADQGPAVALVFDLAPGAEPAAR